MRPLGSKQGFSQCRAYAPGTGMTIERLGHDLDLARSAFTAIATKGMTETPFEPTLLNPRLVAVAQAAQRGAPSKELEGLVVDNAVMIERSQLADANRVAEQLLRRLVAAGRIPPGVLDRSP
jgi:hypothetical protein